MDRRNRCALGWLLMLLSLAGCPPQTLTPREPFYADLIDDPLAGSQLGQNEHARTAMGEVLEQLRAGRTVASLNTLRRIERFASREEMGPVHAMRGLVHLSANDLRRAEQAVDQCTKLDATSPSCVLVRAALYYARGEDAAVLATLEERGRAVPLERGCSALIRRASARRLEREVEQARAAERAADLPNALIHIRAALAMDPANPTLMRKQGSLSLSLGENRRAAEAYERVCQLEPGNPDDWLGLGEALMRLGDRDGARNAFERAASLPGGLDRARERVAEVRDQERTAVDPNVARVASAEAIDRAGLAAMLTSQLHSLKALSAAARPVVLTDVQSSWARTQIQELVAAGIFEVYDNHTFRPDAIVTRAMLAKVVGAVLQSFREAGWLTERKAIGGAIGDIPPEHLIYSSVVAVLSYGVMSLEPDGTFHPAEAVSGQQASEVVSRLARLAR